MTVALYMDEHVPHAVTYALRLRGIDVLTAQEDGGEGEPDEVLLARATTLGRVLFSQDEDLLRISTQRQREGLVFAGLVFARQTECTIGGLVSDLELVATLSEPAEMADIVLYLPLR